MKKALGGHRFEGNVEIEEFVRKWLEIRPLSFFDEGMGQVCVQVRRLCKK